MNTSQAGFLEIEHTADWELKVWAADLAELFIQAARGMMALSGFHLESGPSLDRQMHLEAADHESLLVAFLNELLFIGEQEQLGFDHFSLTIENGQLSAQLSGAPIQSLDKEIKAVTYHRLAIKQTEHGCETRIVFDV
jgi:SHS2 domain-containing protein